MGSDALALLSALGGAVTSAVIREAQQVFADHRAARIARAADVRSRISDLERQVVRIDARLPHDADSDERR